MGDSLITESLCKRPGSLLPGFCIGVHHRGGQKGRTEMPLDLQRRSPRLSERPSEDDRKKQRQEDAQAQYDRGIETLKLETKWLAGFVYGVVFGCVLMLFLLIT